jgi:hypothetical protein
LAFAVPDPATHQRILDSECIAPNRRGMSLRSYHKMNAVADHGCTGGIGSVPAVRVETMLKRRSVFPRRTATMISRTAQMVVRFQSAFSLPGFDLPQPPGEYRIDHDEELIEIASRLAWRRVATFIHLPAISAKGSTQQMVPIIPADLDAALEKDHMQP